jgi:hypothetical protein
MKFIDICGGISLPLSNIEYTLYERIEKTGIYFDDLSEREQTIVQNMISRGIINYEYINENIKLSVNNLEDVWRD